VIRALIVTDLIQATLCGLTAPIAAFDISQQDVLDSNSPNIFTETIDPCSLVDSPKANASVQLSSWLECAVNGIYNTIISGFIILM
jgi:hypothetical protein